MVLRNGHHQLAAEVSGRLMRRTSVMRYPTRGCQCDPPSRLTAAPPSGNSCVDATWKPISRLTRKVISIPAHSATDDVGWETMAVIERFRFLHHAILRHRHNYLTTPRLQVLSGLLTIRLNRWSGRPRPVIVGLRSSTSAPSTRHGNRWQPYSPIVSSYDSHCSDDKERGSCQPHSVSSAGSSPHE
jgi:hypothetical protein